MSKDPHIANIFSAEEEDCLSLEQMTAYQEDRLQGQEKHAVERHLLNCELCAMTIESLAENDAASIAAGAEEISDSAWDRLQHRESRKRRGDNFWLVSAASIALIITVGYFGFKGPSDEKIGEVMTHAMTETPLLQPDSDANNSIAMAENPQTEEQFGAVNALGEDLKQPATNEQNADPDAGVKTVIGGTDGIGSDRQRDNSSKESIKGSGEVKNLQAKPSPMPSATSNADMAAHSGMQPSKAVLAEPTAKDIAMKEAQPKRANDVKSVAEAKKRDANLESESSFDDMADGDFAASEEMVTSGRTNERLEDVVVVDARRKNEKQAKTAEKSKAIQAAPTGNAGMTAPAPAAPATNFYADGITDYEQGNFQEAAAKLRKATEVTPDNLQAHLYAADAYLRVSQPHAALFHIERILALPGNSNFETAEWYKALALLQLKEGRKAQKQLESVIARNGKFKALAEDALKELK